MGRAMVASVSLPAEITKEIERLAKEEHRTKSGVVQEAIRQYLEMKKWQNLQTKLSHLARRHGVETDGDVEKIVDEVRK